MQFDLLLQIIEDFVFPVLSEFVRINSISWKIDFLDLLLQIEFVISNSELITFNL